MNKCFTFLILYLLLPLHNFSQIILVPGEDVMSTAMSSETGFLPGKKFRIYKAINHYDFEGLKLSVKITDNRSKLNLQLLNCSITQLANLTEFAKQSFIYTFGQYTDSIFKQANIKIDQSAAEELVISIEAMDARLIGFGEIRAHGLCQITAKYKGNEKTYCVDITDLDPNSPISSRSFVTRKTAIRTIGSAAIREVLEKILTDLKTL